MLRRPRALYGMVKARIDDLDDAGLPFEIGGMFWISVKSARRLAKWLNDASDWWEGRDA